MRTYATRKEDPGMFTTYRREQRVKSFVRGKKSDMAGKSFDETVTRILEEFSGEIVSGRNIGMYRVENLF